MQVWLQGSLALEFQSCDFCMVHRLEGTQKVACEDSRGREEKDVPQCNLDRRPQWLGGCLFLEMTPPTLLRPIFSYYQSLQHLALEGHFFFQLSIFGGRAGTGIRNHCLGMNPGQQEVAALTPRSHHPIICHPARAAGSRAADCLMKTERWFRLCTGAASPLPEVTFRNTPHYRADIGQGWDTY